MKWSNAYQSYDSAGDEAESFCPICDQTVIEEEDNYCKKCGYKLVYRNDDLCNLKEKDCLFKLPCKPGDTFYFIGFSEICKYVVECIDIYDDRIVVIVKIDYEDRHGFDVKEFGESCFINYEDAVKAKEKYNG